MPVKIISKPTPGTPLRAISFIDGQNLHHAAKEAWGYSYPNYDPLKLSQEICQQQGWQLAQTRFYTGVPDSKDNSFWNHFWSKKFLFMRRQKVYVFSRKVRYILKDVICPNGQAHKVLVGDEKGIDVRIAIDVISLAFLKRYDVALVFSQDQDLSEVADEIRLITKRTGAPLKVASAFPKNPAKKHLNRGINKTDWIPFDKALYDTCLDPRDYRPAKS